VFLDSQCTSSPIETLKISDNAAAGNLSMRQTSRRQWDNRSEVSYSYPSSHRVTPAIDDARREHASWTALLAITAGKPLTIMDVRLVWVKLTREQTELLGCKIDQSGT
jgi:hypothetical protein